MINLKQNPVEWASLMYELDDLNEHLESLIDEMNDKGEISVEEYQVQIGHLYAHLNRAWNSSCLLYTSPSPRDLSTSRMPSSA